MSHSSSKRAPAPPTSRSSPAPGSRRNRRRHRTADAVPVAVVVGADVVEGVRVDGTVHAPGPCTAGGAGRRKVRRPGRDRRDDCTPVEPVPMTPTRLPVGRHHRAASGPCDRPAAELVHARDVREVGRRQQPDAVDDELGRQVSPVSVTTVHRPVASSNVGRFDRGVERDAAPKVEAVGDVVQVGQDLRLPRVALVPVPLVVKLAVERVAVRRDLGVASGRPGRCSSTRCRRRRPRCRSPAPRGPSSLRSLWIAYRPPKPLPMTMASTCCVSVAVPVTGTSVIRWSSRWADGSCKHAALQRRCAISRRCEGGPGPRATSSDGTDSPSPAPSSGVITQAGEPTLAEAGGDLGRRQVRLRGA